MHAHVTTVERACSLRLVGSDDIVLDAIIENFCINVFMGARTLSISFIVSTEYCGFFTFFLKDCEYCVKFPD
jgi:hypothetical protein